MGVGLESLKGKDQLIKEIKELKEENTRLQNQYKELLEKVQKLLAKNSR